MARVEYTGMCLWRELGAQEVQGVPNITPLGSFHALEAVSGVKTRPLVVCLSAYHIWKLCCLYLLMVSMLAHRSTQR